MASNTYCSAPAASTTLRKRRNLFSDLPNPTTLSPHLKDAKGEGREKLESLAAPPSAAEAAAASSLANPSGRPSPSTPRLRDAPQHRVRLERRAEGNTEVRS
jgi:hypothetical protein